MIPASYIDESTSKKVEISQKEALLSLLVVRPDTLPMLAACAGLPKEERWVLTALANAPNPEIPHNLPVGARTVSSRMVLNPLGAKQVEMLLNRLTAKGYAVRISQTPKRTFYYISNPDLSDYISRTRSLELPEVFKASERIKP